MKRLIMPVIIAALAGCRGEPTPRDYQNHPSTISNPPATSSETPGAHGRAEAPPQPSTGVEGKTQHPIEPATTLSDTPPATATSTPPATTTT
jgi:hypothetical protein